METSIKVTANMPRKRPSCKGQFVRAMIFSGYESSIISARMPQSRPGHHGLSAILRAAIGDAALQFFVDTQG
jgi:hypothetical protein